jgi:hypothetical protein
MAKKSPGSWLTASALLGIPRTLQLMREAKLPLAEAEAMLREEAEHCLSLLKTPKGEQPAELPWAKLKLSRFEPWGFVQKVDTGDGEDLVPADDEAASQLIFSREDKRRKKHSGGKNYRHLWSWLGDVGTERGEKLRIALGQKSSRDDAWKIRAQIEQDSKAVLEALWVLERKLPSAAARWNGKPLKGKQAKLMSSAVRLSLEVSTHNDTEKTLRQELEQWLKREHEAQREVLAHRIALADLEESWSKAAKGKKSGKLKRS